MTKQIKKTATAQALSDAFKTASEALVIGIQDYLNSKDVIQNAITAMRSTKVVFGKTRATCAMLQFVYDQLGTLKTNKGKPLAVSTRNDYLNAIKVAVKTGNELNLNTRRKPKPAGQSQTPKIKDKAALTEENPLDIPSMASEEKPAPIKVGAYKSNEDAIEALKVAIKTVKSQCTIAQWKAITTLYTATAKLAE